jgi:hypothetical protein
MDDPPNTPSPPPALFTPACTSDPYPTYRHHLQGPALQLLDAPRRLWGAFRYETLQALLRDGRLSSARPPQVIVRAGADEMPEFAELVAHMQRWLLLKDAPSHTSLRKALNRGFSPAVMEPLRPRIEQEVHRMLETVGSMPEIDVVRDLAYPLPVRIISSLLGVPDAQLDRCVELSTIISIWFASVVRLPATARPAQAAILELVQIFRDIVARRRARERGDDLLDLLLQIAAADTVLTDDDLLAQCVMLLFGGHETTRHWIGNSVHTFLEQPRILEELRDDPGLVRPAMEEVLRYQSPVQMFGRVVVRDIELEGETMRAGDSVMLVVGAANGDPRQFQSPDRFDLRRAHNRHFTFGGDAHVCLGSTLARLEGAITVSELIRRFPELGLAQETPQWSSMIGFRGLDALRVRLH